MWCKLKKNGDFHIYSYYNKLRGSYSVIILWKGIWGIKAPRRVSFFVWIAAWGKILTGDNLRRRGSSIVDWCYMCPYIGETMDHLMIHGKRAYLLWSFDGRTFAISWVLQGRVIDLLFGWRNWLGKYLFDIWNLIAFMFDVVHLEGV